MVDVSDTIDAKLDLLRNSSVDSKTSQQLADLMNEKNDKSMWSPKQLQYLWSCVVRYESHASEDELLVIKQARKTFVPFSKKQQNKDSASTKSRKRSGLEDQRCFVRYDGPDDIDRYQGHGEWDTDTGYYE